MNNREIDALIAEKVMGWNKKDKKAGEFSKWFDGDKFICHAVAWYPTISLEKAWQVAESLEEQFRCSVSLTILSSCMSKPHRYSISVQGGILEYEHPSCLFGLYADTASMAICLAALKAVGVEPPGSLLANAGGQALPKGAAGIL